VTELLQQMSVVVQQSAEAVERTAEQMQAIAAQAAKPKRVKIVRDGAGRAVGAETVAN
jgi:hypothetical protein